MRIFARRDAGGSHEAVATYAAVLDGSHLWWYVEGVDRLLLRPADGSAGPDVAVETDPFPLDGLTADAYDVLADGRPVLVGDLPDRAPARAPLTDDGRAQWAVHADRADPGPDGRLRLVRREVVPTAVLDTVELHGDRIHLRLVPPPGVGADELLVLDDEDHVLTRLAPSFAAADLPDDALGVFRLAVGSPDAWVRIRRSDTGLADPNAAVLLPELPDPGHPDRARVRLRWSPDSLLAVRLLDPEADSGPPGPA